MKGEAGGYPFAGKMEEKNDVIPGKFSEVKSFLNDKKWLVKEYSGVNDFAEHFWKFRNEKGEADVPRPELTWDRFQAEMIKHRNLLRKFGSEKLLGFVPANNLVFGNNDAGEKTGFIVMRRVSGEEIDNMAEVPNEMVSQLEELVAESVLMYKRSLEDPIYQGYFPDLMPPREDKNIRFGNLIWGEIDGKQQLYWVDTYPLRQYENPKELAADLEIMMTKFEEEKGVKFSDGFVDRILGSITEAKQKPA